MSKLYPGNNVSHLLTFKDGLGKLYDPDTITCQYFTPDMVLLDTKTKEDCVRESEGVFTVNYKLPADAAAGVWTLRVNSTFAATGLDRTAEFTFSVSTQPYGSLAGVKYLASLKDEVLDEELIWFMEKATAFVDDALKAYVQTLPLSPVPSAVASIAEFYAAGLYYQRNMQDEKAHSYLTYAEKKLSEYVESTYLKPYTVVKATAYREINEDE